MVHLIGKLALQLEIQMARDLGKVAAIVQVEMTTNHKRGRGGVNRMYLGGRLNAGASQ